PSLRTFGELDKEVVVIGVGSRIEIWSKEIWDKYKDDELEDVSDLADSLEGLNL
ncbi:MAG: cell division/cell wall cluster transcriptional repressor MraZ, partial [Firmicutes bacterium HGW-Firmicutes-5]